VSVDWESYQKCDVCPAELGKPCVKLSGWHLASIVIQADEPHSTRKLRAEAAREGGERG
jgi:hypothetical protein